MPALSDIKQYTDPLQTHSLSADLNSWGKVNFVTMLILGYKPRAAAFLTNEHGDIFDEGLFYASAEEIMPKQPISALGLSVSDISL